MLSSQIIECNLSLTKPSNISNVKVNLHGLLFKRTSNSNNQTLILKNMVYLSLHMYKMQPILIFVSVVVPDEPFHILISTFSIWLIEKAENIRGNCY